MEKQKELEYSVGDWLVHALYGIGQIVAVETKFFSQQEQVCYKVKTKDSTFWVPVDQIDNKRVRSLAAPERIKRALQVLEKPPRPLSTDYKKRDKQIIEAKSDRSLRSRMELIRDLTVYEKKNGLSKSNRDTLERIRQRFLEEWSVCMEIELKEARQQLDRMLRENINMASAQQDPAV